MELSSTWRAVTDISDLQKKIIEAVWKEDIDQLTLLCRNSDVNLDFLVVRNLLIGSLHQYSPLLLALHTNNIQIVGILIENGANVNFVFRKWLPGGADLFNKDMLDETSAVLSCYNCHNYCEMLPIILNAGGDPFLVHQRGLSTVCMISEFIFYDYRESLKILIGCGTDLNKVVTADNMVNSGHSPLAWCDTFWDENTDNFPDLTYFLLKNGARLNTKDISEHVYEEILSGIVQLDRERQLKSHQVVEIFISFLREGIDLDHSFKNVLLSVTNGAPSQMCDEDGHTLLELSILHSNMMYAKLCWVAGSERGKASFWKRSDLDVVLPEPDFDIEYLQQIRDADKEPMAEYLSSVIQQPRALSDIARIAVRSNLGHGQMPEKISRLCKEEGLHLGLQDFLCLSELETNCSNYL